MIYIRYWRYKGLYRLGFDVHKGSRDVTWDNIPFKHILPIDTYYQLSKTEFGKGVFVKTFVEL